MNRKANLIILLFLTIVNIFFPLLGFIVIAFCYLLSNLNHHERKIVYLNVSFSMAFLGFNYMRIEESGDLYRYGLSYYYYYRQLVNGRTEIILGLYESFYPSWYFLFYCFAKLGLTFKWIVAFAGFTIYSVALYIIHSLDCKFHGKNIDKSLFVKIFLISSFIGIFSSFKTMWAISLIFLGIYYLIEQKRLGYLFLIFGLGIHPIGFILIFTYYISTKINFTIKHMVYALFVGIFVKISASTLSLFHAVPFIGNKINTYMIGDWANYRFHEMGEYVKFFLLVVVVLYFLIVFKYQFINKSEDAFLYRYNKFIRSYLTVSFLFMGFRTISTRLLLDSVIVFFPLFYQVLYERRIYKKRIVPFVLFIIWILMIDIRTFNYTNTSYQIGSGFPLNLLDSPVLKFCEAIL